MSTKEIIERAEAELYALGEYGEEIRPNTFSDLLEELKKLRNALVDGAIEQYKRENTRPYARSMSSSARGSDPPRNGICSTHESAPQDADAIQAIAAGENRPPPCGYVVCRRDTVERTDRDHRNGFIYSPLSAIFERLDQAQNVMEGCGKREGHYVIFEIQEWKP